MADRAVGFGSGVTGGAGGEVVKVTNVLGLEYALRASGKVIIVVMNDLEFDGYLSLNVADKTVVGMPGVKLTSSRQDVDGSGILYLKGKNVIIRNLTFVGPGAFDCDPSCGDLLAFKDMQGAWVDHCDFQDGVDGNFDIKNNTDNVTVSYCRFRYLRPPVSGGNETDDHRFSNLIGSGSSDMPEDERYSITYDHCWWDNGCVGRMTRCRNADIHYLNCYWESNVAKYYIGPENASSYFEGCAFKKVKADKIINETYGGENSYKFVNCWSEYGLPEDKGTVDVPNYPYKIELAGDVEYTVKDENCGAGATLNVTENGEVSSNCPVHEINPDAPWWTPKYATSISTFWNISDTDFPLGTISTPMSIRKLLFVADSKNSMSINESEALIDGQSFRKALDLSYVKSNSRYIGFRVTGPCLIEVYAMPFGMGGGRTFSLAVGSLNNIKATLRAPQNGTKNSYYYSGGEDDIYIYSNISGVYIYGIRVDYENGTGIESPYSTDELTYDGEKIVNSSGNAVSIYSALGTLMYSGYDEQIMASEWPKGMYIIRHRTGSMKIVVR